MSKHLAMEGYVVNALRLLCFDVCVGVFPVLLFSFLRCLLRAAVGERNKSLAGAHGENNTYKFKIE